MTQVVLIGGTPLCKYFCAQNIHVSLRGGKSPPSLHPFYPIYLFIDQLLLCILAKHPCMLICILNVYRVRVKKWYPIPLLDSIIFNCEAQAGDCSDL